ncbi:MAG: thioredoxin-disulfide reductase, partial [Clostridia bacterium]|nr:thioredoxin-disulfide reductase [Clostridia bacterium]
YLRHAAKLALQKHVEIETVTSVTDGDIKLVLTEDGNTYEAKAVIVATGVKHRMLGLAGEYGFVGNGISFCAVCDGDFYAGQTVAVIGGGNSALQEATLLSDVCKSVIVVQDLDEFTGEERLSQSLFERTNVTAHTGCVAQSIITENGEFRGITVLKKSDGSAFDIRCDGMFVAIGLIPENNAFRNILPIDERGYVSAGEDCLTGRSGIFAAGDCRSKSVRQVATACADGAVAAIAACACVDGR